MRTIKLFFLLAPAFFACAGVNAQVTIGGIENPKAGAILDLNSTVKGGLLLSNVDITNLDSIPTGSNTFSGVSPDSLDVNWGLRGAIVYNTNPKTAPGIYVWTGRYWMPIDETESVEIEVEQILFTVRIGSDGDDSYAIPTSGMLNLTNHAYDWDVTVDGQSATATNCTDGYCSGTGSMSDAGVNGIQLSNLTPGNHQIRITPHGKPAPGWGNAFGHCFDLDDAIFPGANAQTNREKLISIDAPLSTLAFAPKTDESVTNADFMFAGVFSGCTSLTTPAVIRDSYKLPATITDLSFFLSGIHFRNDALDAPIDLKLLKNWLNNNSSIKNLSGFLLCVHYVNARLAAPIDLTPLRDWFNNNSSIENLSVFLAFTHNDNPLLATPINLTPLSGWFNGNNSIIDLSDFLALTHNDNPLLATPINLTPLSDWFKSNQSIKNLMEFLMQTHNLNYALAKPIVLTPLSGWFNGNSSITNLSNFLEGTHANNTKLTDPINLTPLSSWFSDYMSINNLSYFLESTHANNTKLTDPINLTPLSGWFSDYMSINNLSYFLSRTHYGNSSLTLSGQSIFPNWIKTMQEGNTPIWDAYRTFYETFSLDSEKSNDSGEPTFQESTTVLSSMGNPNSPKYTYRNRTGFTTIGANWK